MRRDVASDGPSALQIQLPFPAMICGIDRAGKRFKLQTVLDSLSPHDLYLQLTRPVQAA